MNSVTCGRSFTPLGPSQFGQWVTPVSWINLEKVSFEDLGMWRKRGVRTCLMGSEGYRCCFSSTLGSTRHVFLSGFSFHISQTSRSWAQHQHLFLARGASFCGPLCFPRAVSVYVQSRDHILLTQRNLLGLPGFAVTWREMCFFGPPACSSLCKIQQRAGPWPSLHFTSEHTFESLLGRTSPVVSIWGVS